MSDYALEKFESAVDKMATSTAKIQDRLASAAHNLIPVRPEDIPEDVGLDFDPRMEFGKLWSILTRTKPIAGDSGIDATVAKMSDAECERTAKLMIRIRLALQVEHDDALEKKRRSKRPKLTSSGQSRRLRLSPWVSAGTRRLHQMSSHLITSFAGSLFAHQPDITLRSDGEEIERAASGEAVQ